MRRITEEAISNFARRLRQEDRSPGTQENYLRHIRTFTRWMGNLPVTPESAAQWKAHLLDRSYAPGTVNAMLVPLNRFFAFLGWRDCQVKTLRIQRRMFRENRPGADPKGICPAPLCGPGPGEGAAGPAHGGYLRHRYPGVRGAIPHRGGSGARQGPETT